MLCTVRIWTPRRLAALDEAAKRAASPWRKRDGGRISPPPPDDDGDGVSRTLAIVL